MPSFFTPNPPLLAASVLVLALLPLAGCGGDGQPGRVQGRVTPAVSLSAEEAGFARAAGVAPEGAAEALGRGRAFCRGEGDGGSPSVDALIQHADDPVYATAVTRLCPEHLPLLRQAEGGFLQGAVRVGEGPGEIAPGRYRTTRRDLRGCSWRRWADGGHTIDNAVVTDAPDGVTVTIEATDGGFTSENCGNWVPVR